MVKIMLFAKSYGWIHASMALPLGPKNYDENFFWTGEGIKIIKT
jgi:hypothetical protein